MKPAGLEVFGGNLHPKYPGSLAATGILQRARTKRPFHEKRPVNSDRAFSLHSLIQPNLFP
jgi:hypothetical protein